MSATCRSVPRFSVCLLLIAVSSLAVHALPGGFKEDFNGCATQSPTNEDRARCCQETLRQCMDQCERDVEAAGDDSGIIMCHTDCIDGLLHCEDGRTLPLTVAWPGNPGADVPGLSMDGDRIVPASKYDLVASRGEVLVELRGQGVSAPDACVAFVVACRCPYGASSDQECRARMDGKATACQICKRGASAEACKPCPDCRPELLSEQRCAAPALPAPRDR